jgi:AraC-like DNA-binding protein
MDFLTNASSLMIAVAAVLTFYTALLHLTRSGFHRGYLFRVIRDLIVGTQTLQLYFITRNLHLAYPFLLYGFITLLFIGGALSYIRYFLFFYPGGKIPRRVLAQMLPAALIFVGETWFYFSSPERSQAEIRAVFTDPPAHFLSYVILTGLVVLLIQNGMLLNLELGFRNNEKVRAPVLLSSILNVFYMIGYVFTGSGFFLANPALMDSGILILGLTGIIYLLFENRYPSFYRLVAQEERQKKYRKSLIQGLSQNKIIARLQELMEEEKIYRQLELKLEDVAALLFITPHQLSEFINDCMGMNFATYVNRYRIEEAKTLLIEQPEKNTLSICFEVGFGSKQSFNTLFKQHTGMTPTEYRKSQV